MRQCAKSLSGKWVLTNREGPCTKCDCRARKRPAKQGARPRRGSGTAPISKAKRRGRLHPLPTRDRRTPGHGVPRHRGRVRALPGDTAGPAHPDSQLGWSRRPPRGRRRGANLGRRIGGASSLTHQDRPKGATKGESDWSPSYGPGFVASGRQLRVRPTPLHQYRCRTRYYGHAVATRRDVLVYHHITPRSASKVTMAHAMTCDNAQPTNDQRAQEQTGRRRQTPWSQPGMFLTAGQSSIVGAVRIWDPLHVSERRRPRRAPSHLAW